MKAIREKQSLHNIVHLAWCNSAQERYDSGSTPASLYLAVVTKHLARFQTYRTSDTSFTFNPNNTSQSLGDYLANTAHEQFTSLKTEGHVKDIVGFGDVREAAEPMRVEENGRASFVPDSGVAELSQPCVIERPSRHGLSRFTAYALVKGPSLDARSISRENSPRQIQRRERHDRRLPAHRVALSLMVRRSDICLRNAAHSPGSKSCRL